MCVVVLAGCTMGPDYKRPAVALPTTWSADARFQAAASAPSTDAAVTAAPADVDMPSGRPPVGGAELIDTAWWSALGDPQLDALIRSALEENKNLQIAAQRIEQFGSNLQVSMSAGQPQVIAGASRSRDTLSENRQLPLVVGAQPVDNSYEVSGRVSWELDLWGKVARSNQAALAALLGSQENRRALVLSLIADVAASYVRLLGLDDELQLMRRNIASQRESIQVLTARFRGGGSPELPVLRAQADLEQLLADLPAKENEIAALEHALCGLIGRNPGPIPRGKPVQALLLPAIPAGLPAQVLGQRPDVRKAEQDLIAANARIGVAAAQYFPDISLTAQSGFASAELSKLTLLTSNFGTFGISLLGPIFSSGRISGQVREAEAVQRQMATAYVLSVQTALLEVEDALVAHRKTHQRAALRVRQLKALQDVRTSAVKRYEGGFTSYTDVLEAERGTFVGELQLSQSRRDQFAAVIAVYKAMGGGWSVANAPSPSSSLTIRTDHHE